MGLLLGIAIFFAGRIDEVLLKLWKMFAWLPLRKKEKMKDVPLLSPAHCMHLSLYSLCRNVKNIWSFLPLGP